MAAFTDAIGFLTPIGPREINTIPLDAVLEETVLHTVAVTDHPIEVPSANGPLRGAVSDNAFLLPTLYTLEGTVSDFPISWRRFVDRYANASGDTRSLSAYQLLLEHFRKLIPFTLDTPLGPLDNMLFTAFKVPRNSLSKHAIIFTAELRELQVVVTNPIAGAKEVEDVSGEQAQVGAVPEVSRGETAGTPVSSGSVLGNLFSGAP